MLDFREAIVYGKYTFGKSFHHCTETDDGWLFFLDKNGKSLGEEQTWDEFEYTWEGMKKHDSKFAKFIKVKKNWPKW